MSFDDREGGKTIFFARSFFWLVFAYIASLFHYHNHHHRGKSLKATIIRPTDNYEANLSKNEIVAVPWLAKEIRSNDTNIILRYDNDLIKLLIKHF